MNTPKLAPVAPMAGAGRFVVPFWRAHLLPNAAVRSLCWLLLSALVCLTVASLLIGATAQVGITSWLIFIEIRLPRTVLAILVGAGLGIAGAGLQGYLRNPLAEPGILGTSSGAAFFAVLAIHTGLASSGALGLPLAGLAGAALATLAVIGIAGPRAGPLPVILAGVAVSSFATAAMAFALNLARNPFASAESIFWLMGSVTDRSLVHLAIAGPLILVGVLLLLSTAPALDALSLGEATAETLGIDPARTRWFVVLGTALAVGSATAVTGIIGFVGLIVPHILRRAVGHRPGALLLPSAIGGACLLVIADIAVRLLSPVIDVRIGVLTAMIGAPLFLWLAVNAGRSWRP